IAAPSGNKAFLVLMDDLAQRLALESKDSNDVACGLPVAHRNNLIICLAGLEFRLAANHHAERDDANFAIVAPRLFINFTNYAACRLHAIKGQEIEIAIA